MARRRRARTATPPSLSSLIILLLVLGGIWLYQNGYFDRFLPATAQPVPPALEAPEQKDDSPPEAPAAPQPTLPQPSVESQAEPPAPSAPAVDTPSLRGYRGAWYQVYFTKPKYPERAADRSGGLDQPIAADIDAARHRVELVSFDFDLQSIADALIRAKQRGVQVRVSIDGENLDTPAVSKLTGALEAAGIPLFYDQRQAFMHNKFVVIDDSIVWTGSANMTVNDVFRNNNNMLRIVDSQLAQNYTAKADDIFKGQGGPSGPSVLINPTVSLDGTTVRNAFAPDDPITQMIVERINQARQTIDVLAFAFTSDPIGRALMAARDRGVAVRGVMESRNTKGTGSEFKTLRDAGIDLQADGNCYIMHDKVFVIDGQIVVTGSFNFTRGAQEQNDENVLIIDDRNLAARYGEEFERIYEQALQPPRCG